MTSGATLVEPSTLPRPTTAAERVFLRDCTSCELWLERSGGYR